MQDSTMVVDIWVYADPRWSRIDLAGFAVEGTDGEIGRVDEAGLEPESQAHLIVETGSWIFGKKVMLPAGVISAIDLDNRKLFVDVAKDKIERAPEWDVGRTSDPIFREELGSYYGANRPAGPDYGAAG